MGASGADGKSPNQQQQQQQHHTEGNGAVDSMNMFSPQAQSQLQEFDLLRAEIEGGATGVPAETNNNNNGM